jgi:hypothetical protein
MRRAAPASNSVAAPIEWNLATRSRGVAVSTVGAASALAVAGAAAHRHAPFVAAASVVLAAVMVVVAVRCARRRTTLRIEGTRAVAQHAGRIIWAVEHAAIRSVLLHRSSGGAYEVRLALWGGGALIVPAHFDATSGQEFGSELGSMLQSLRTSETYRG